MDAFEQLVAELFFAEGYWVETSFKVDLTKEEKVRIGRMSTPRWEIDVVAYKASTDELLAIECKSFLDSTGVQWAELQDGHASKRYKLFREPLCREVVLERLRLQMVESGRCRNSVAVRLAMVAGKIKRGDEPILQEHFSANAWGFYGPDWLRARLTKLASGSYSNQVSAVVAKLLLRDVSSAPSQAGFPRSNHAPSGRRPSFGMDQLITLQVTENPKQAGSAARVRFEHYFQLKERTVAEALSLGLRRDDLSYDVAHGHITIS